MIDKIRKWFAAGDDEVAFGDAPIAQAVAVLVLFAVLAVAGGW